MVTDIPETVAHDPWFREVGSSRRHWAVVINAGECWRIVFYDDRCGVFDEISCGSYQEALMRLVELGFWKYRDVGRVLDLFPIPSGEFREIRSPSGRVYSRGTLLF